LLFPLNIRYRLAIKEPENNEKSNRNEDTQFLDISYLNGNETSGREHDRGDGESISVGKFGDVSECSDEDDSDDHENPVHSRDVDLALDGL
jgi:hypothetical protein